MGVLEKFIVIVSSIILSTLLGYISKRKGLLKEDFAGRIFFYSVLFAWTPPSFFVLWRLKLTYSVVSLPFFYPAATLIMIPISYLLIRILRLLKPELDNRTLGTLFVSFLISNIGYTMGGFVCYSLYGMDGLGYAQLYTSSWVIPIIGFSYPIARAFSEGKSRLDIKFILTSFLDVRALPVVGVLLGIVFNLSGIKPIEWIYKYHIVDLWVIAAILSSFFAIGLQLNLSFEDESWYFHLLLFIVKFIISPLVTFILLYLADSSGLILLPELARKVVIIESFVPTAVFSVIISSLFDLNPRLATYLFVVNTLLFLVVVLPFIVVVFA